ncbi:MAG: GAF domain-containing protein, partial [Candidatus Binatia bacterium]
LAHYLPDIYQQLEHARSNDPARVPALEKELLGQPLYRLAVTIAKQWHMPQAIIQLMETKPTLSGKPLTAPGEQLEGLVSCANALGHCLLNPPTPSTQSTFRDLMKKIPTSFNLSPKTVETLTVRAFEKACQFADAVKIEKDFFVPDRGWAPPDTDSPHHNLFKGIWKVAGAVEADESREDNVDREGPPPPTPLASSTAAASQAMLAFLQDFTLKALGTSDPNLILNLATEGLFSAAKFERVVLTLISPASGMLEPRVSYGDQVQTLLPLFRCRVKDHHLLTTSLKGGEPVKVESLRAEMNAGRVPPEFIYQWGEGPCLLGPLYAKSRSVGVIVVDRGITGQPITQADFATFVMVLAQVNTNLTRLASH